MEIINSIRGGDSLLSVRGPPHPDDVFEELELALERHLQLAAPDVRDSVLAVQLEGDGAQDRSSVGASRPRETKLLHVAGRTVGAHELEQIHHAFIDFLVLEENNLFIDGMSFISYLTS